MLKTVGSSRGAGAIHEMQFDRYETMAAPPEMCDRPKACSLAHKYCYFPHQNQQIQGSPSIVMFTGYNATGSGWQVASELLCTDRRTSCPHFIKQVRHPTAHVFPVSGPLDNSEMRAGMPPTSMMSSLFRSCTANPHRTSAALSFGIGSLLLASASPWIEAGWKCSQRLQYIGEGIAHFHKNALKSLNRELLVSFMIKSTLNTF